MRPPPPASETHLYLVRHGATPANESQPYTLQGSGIDLPLSPTGEKQVVAAGEFLRDFPIKHVYSSTLKRAQQSALMIASHHGLPVQMLPSLCECDVGRWEGMDWETITREYPEETRRFLENPAEHPYYGGESYGDVARRVGPTLAELLGRHRGESIAVVAHNVVNRVYLASLLGIELRRAKDLKQQNACVNLIVRDDHGTSLFTMNSTFHLPEPSLA